MATKKKSNDDAKITILAKENPKRKGSAAAKRFALYTSGMKVSTALEKGVTRGDLRHDTAHKFIEVS